MITDIKVLVAIASEPYLFDELRQLNKAYHRKSVAGENINKAFRAYYHHKQRIETKFPSIDFHEMYEIWDHEDHKEAHENAGKS